MYSSKRRSYKKRQVGGLFGLFGKSKVESVKKKNKKKNLGGPPWPAYAYCTKSDDCQGENVCCKDAIRTDDPDVLGLCSKPSKEYSQLCDNWTNVQWPGLDIRQDVKTSVQYKHLFTGGSRRRSKRSKRSKRLKRS